MNQMTQTITQRYKELPQVMQEYIKDDAWSEQFQTILTKHSLDAEQSEGVKFEMFLYLLAMQDKQELIQQIKDSLPNMPGPISGMISNELLDLVPEEVKSTITEIFEAIDAQGSAPDQETSTDTEVSTNLPEHTPVEGTEDESKSGVDILPEKKEIEDTTEQSTLGRNSLINSMEHPEQSTQTEQSITKQQPSSFNPIASKLGGSTQGASENSTPSTSKYGGEDPYREPTN